MPKCGGADFRDRWAAWTLAATSVEVGYFGADEANRAEGMFGVTIRNAKGHSWKD
jgi:hypothetical protein